MIEIIKRPLVTEKAMKLSEVGQYCFIVDPDANKIEIKKAIEDLFEVKVNSIRTLRAKGKVKTKFTKKGLMRGSSPLRKKAYVTLKEGYTIDIVSGTAGDE
ncbi:MAG: 50S ribosomal protein L23 [Candidatus Kapabacteria bacterium]|jgi:large subunit ribosomal protein L23|nr:50S ribosomal protein L23 [Candidatus Kapabacteria bacterium]